MGLPSMTINITWLLMNDFTIVILDMDSAPHVEYSDAVPCGYKQLSDGWTSNNKQLDEFIRKSQLQTNSPNHAYLEWIPYDCIRDRDRRYGYVYLNGLPTPNHVPVKLTPLEITDETHDSYYAEVNYLLMRHVY